MADELHALIGTLSPEDQAEVMAVLSDGMRREREYVTRSRYHAAHIADMLSEGLPDGMRFGWGPPGA